MSAVQSLTAEASSATSQGGSSVTTTIGGGTDGKMRTQGPAFDNTTISTVVAAGCATVNGMDTTATGLCAKAGSSGNPANGATAYGAYATAQNENTTAVGFRSVASYVGSVAIGYQAQAIADPATAIGANSLASGNNAVALGAGARATANNAVALGAYSVANQANTVSVGSAGNERRITNVAAGVNPTDAVNVSQLHGVQNNISMVQNKVNAVAKTAYAGVAGAVALTMIPDVDLDKRFALGVGIANYQGYGAAAIGFSARVGDATKFKGGVSTNGTDTSLGMGVSYQW
ncbi:YadA-like family protein [Xanthomonas sp. SHU 166]|nr:YadA-like family protein [Xanthomonas sp. SHU 166]